MENNNLEFLKKNLKFLGFGTSLNAALEAKVSERQEFFKIGVSADFNSRQKDGSQGRDKVNYELNFSRSSKPYHYFLDSVKVTLNDQIQNTFSYGKGNDVTAKEAYNLLRGASIHKKAILNRQMDNKLLTSGEVGQVKEGSGEKIESIWIKLDFEKLNEQGNFSYKKFYPDYGFNLEPELSRFPIKELVNAQEREMLISSLGRGNTQMATLETGHSVMIEVDPENKKIQFYDMDFKKLDVLPSLSQELGR
ncbi:hypothetical protein FHS59_003291 [Algoriphagus iocasae]|mgnify:CR=1 FL=1|uniref:Uncharacterized protein n=1 Tax=Algoriphagus iocasae TaxID=1836499 RepID=A0A841MYE9_9BACT|nr:hypothetical protein [Algoriphagus iocasae]MBB6327648.1 hypothetical protein [Algoriphagus iocasae]